MQNSTHEGSPKRVAFQTAVWIGVVIASAAFGYSFGKKSGHAEGFDLGYRQGGESGFDDGFVTGQMSSSAVEGAAAAHISELIRKGDTDGALAFLEGTVDSSLVLYSGFIERRESQFDTTSVAATSRRVMKSVAKHRSAHPPVSQDPGVIGTINDTLASLQP